MARSISSLTRHKARCGRLYRVVEVLTLEAACNPAIARERNPSAAFRRRRNYAKFEGVERFTVRPRAMRGRGLVSFRHVRPRRYEAEAGKRATPTGMLQCTCKVVKHSGSRPL